MPKQSCHGLHRYSRCMCCHNHQWLSCWCQASMHLRILFRMSDECVAQALANLQPDQFDSMQAFRMRNVRLRGQGQSQAVQYDLELR